MELVPSFPPERSRYLTIVHWKPLVLDSDVHLTGLGRPYFLRKWGEPTLEAAQLVYWGTLGLLACEVCWYSV